LDRSCQVRLQELVRQRGGLVNAHSHLDIARVIGLRLLTDIAADYSLDHPARLGELPLTDKIHVLDSRLRTADEYRDTAYSRAASYLDELVAAGGRGCATCVTTSNFTGTAVVDTFGALKRDFADRLTLRLAALHLTPVLDDPQALDAFHKVCAHPEVDMVSGLPQHHPDRTAEYCDIVFDIARDVDKPIEIHVDEYLDPDETETETAAAASLRARDRGYGHQISFVHGITLAAKPRPERLRIAGMLRDADVTMIICPRSALSIASADVSNYLHNAMAPVRELLERGVCIALGTDNIGDVFLPLSSGDLYTEAEFLAEAHRFYDLEAIADMLSSNGARALNLP
jgi:cytosine/creatinine deaminase